MAGQKVYLTNDGKIVQVDEKIVGHDAAESIEEKLSVKADKTEVDTKISDYKPSVFDSDTHGWSGCYQTRTIYIPRVYYTELSSTTDTDQNLKGLLKWTCQKFPNLPYQHTTFVGVAHPNSVGQVNYSIYDTSDVNSSTGLPRYSSGIYICLGGTIYTFGTSNYNWYIYAK